MPTAVTFLHVATVAFIAVFLFLAVNWLEPHRRLATILKVAIIAAAAVALLTQLLP
jgi:hypothetical protein